MAGPILLKSNITPQPRGGVDSGGWGSTSL